ncbi:MAG TPA: hypothetical protein VFD49_03850 [Candidatus Dormibacteraeota bacterium]|nr:hypothetical protein [Candidatus Dormibacteraeota bacterium]
MALKTLRFVAIVCASLALGLTVAHVLERPGKAQLSGAERLAEVLGLAGSLGALPLLRGRRPALASLLIGVLREAPGAPGGAVVVSPTGPDDRRPARA